LKRQTWKNVEVIVADDGSTDTTLGIAEKYKCHVVRSLRRGRAEAKNEGIRCSSGQYLFFVDSDMELTRDVVVKCVELAKEEPRVGGIVIPERSVGSSFWVKVRDFERSFYSGSIVESPRFFPAKLVKEVGGFEEGLTFFEESTLPYKIYRKKYDISPRIGSPILHHEEDFSLARWLRKKFYYGKTIQLYRDAYCDYLRVQTSIWFRYGLFMKSWKRFLSRPKLALGVTLLKGLEYFATTSGLINIKLRSMVNAFQ
jgi:glycosyltransferase involved in cell wall biosynthesis